MIETSLLIENPPIVYHRISGRINKDEAAEGAAKAITLIKSIVKNDTKFDLIMDLRGYIFADLAAHKTWSLEFKNQTILKDYAQRIAIIGDCTEKFVAEKELMESSRLKFFTEFDPAYSWLCH